jgi:hypothetical protein
MNVLSIAQAIVPHIRGSYLNQIFPEEFMQNLSHDRTQKGCCIACMRKMEQHEVYPPGRITPRAICPACWAAMTSNLSQDCWICGSPLDPQAIACQQHAPRDLHHRIHGGKCADYFSLVSARALGVETGVRERPAQVVSGQQSQITYEPQQTIGEIINMVPARQPLPIKVR